MKKLWGGNQESMAVKTAVGSLYLGSSFTSSRGTFLFIRFVKLLPSASRQKGALIKVFGAVLVNQELTNASLKEVNAFYPLESKQGIFNAPFVFLHDLVQWRNYDLFSLIT